MLGQTTFVWVDKRLGQATGELDEPLGGISVILFGDFGHLPTIDVPLQSFPSRKPVAIGYTIYQSFGTCDTYRCTPPIRQ